MTSFWDNVGDFFTIAVDKEFTRQFVKDDSQSNEDPFNYEHPEEDFLDKYEE